MNIDLFNLKDLNQFQWKYQNKHIQIFKNNFRNRSDILEKFEKSLSYINEMHYLFHQRSSELLSRFS
jgi:hypothetical protein